jgi:hypothetical protein
LRTVVWNVEVLKEDTSREGRLAHVRAEPIMVGVFKRNGNISTLLEHGGG